MIVCIHLHTHHDIHTCVCTDVYNIHASLTEFLIANYKNKDYQTLFSIYI